MRKSVRPKCIFACCFQMLFKCIKVDKVPTKTGTSIIRHTLLCDDKFPL